MTTAAKPLSEIAAQWREARKLYDVYGALLECFALGLPPCRELESPIDRAEPEMLARIAEWFVQMDERVHVHQLRQLLQTSKLGTEENLRALIGHHLAKEKKNDADRDKIDFLLVQHLSSCAPPGFYEREVSFDEIAQVLEPVLGEVGLHPPDWLQPLNDATSALDGLRSLRDLLEEGTLEKMRKLKAGAGEMYFGPTALVAITRFNFMVRRTFVRLIAADLHAIRFSIHELEERQVKAVDCTRAGLGKQESLESLRQICHEWKKPFRAAYAAGHNFKELIEVRTAVEEALAGAPAPSAASPQKKEVDGAKGDDGVPQSQQTAKAEAAQAHTANSGVAEFSVTQSSGSAAAAPKSPIHVEVNAPVHEKKTAAPAKAAGLVDASHTESKETAMAQPGDPGPGGSPLFQPVLEQVAQILTANHAKVDSIANVVVGGVKLMLSTWEVAAFVKGGDETADTLQRGVAARAFLLGELDRRKKAAPGADVAGALAAAQFESAKLQERIAAAKQAKDIDAAVNLAATSKRLLALIDEAAKPLK